MDTLNIKDGGINPFSFSRFILEEKDAAAWSKTHLETGEFNVFWRGFPDIDKWVFFPQTIEGTLDGDKYRIDLYSRVQIVLPERCYIFFSKGYQKSKLVKLCVNKPKDMSVDEFINFKFTVKSPLLNEAHPMTPPIEQEAVSFLIRLIATIEV